METSLTFGQCYHLKLNERTLKNKTLVKSIKTDVTQKRQTVNTRCEPDGQRRDSAAVFGHDLIPIQAAQHRNRNDIRTDDLKKHHT